MKHIRLAVEADMPSIMEIIRGRPECAVAGWTAHTGAQVWVALDSIGISAFLIIRIDRPRGKLYADQIEGVRTDGSPTLRGMLGMKRLSDFMERKLAENGGGEIVSAVAIENQQHIVALRRWGYADRVLFLGKVIPAS